MTEQNTETRLTVAPADRTLAYNIVTEPDNKDVAHPDGVLRVYFHMVDKNTPVGEDGMLYDPEPLGYSAIALTNTVGSPDIEHKFDGWYDYEAPTDHYPAELAEAIRQGVAAISSWVYTPMPVIPAGRFPEAEQEVREQVALDVQLLAARIDTELHAANANQLTIHTMRTALREAVRTIRQDPDIDNGDGRV